MDSAARQLIDTLLRSSSTALADVEAPHLAKAGPDGRAARHERLLVLSNRPGTMQLYELADGALTPLTALAEPVTEARYVHGRRAVLATDIGGDERTQLYVIDLEPAGGAPVGDVADLTALTTSPEHGHHLAGVSPDGLTVAYTSNRHNGVDYDLWTVDLETGEHTLAWAGGGYCFPRGGFSPDGRHVTVYLAGRHRPLDGQLMLVDIASGEARELMPHPDEAVEFGDPTWIDTESFHVSSNRGRDFAAIVRYDLARDETVTLPDTGVDGDAIALLHAADAPVTVLLENRDCATPLYRYALESGGETQTGRLESGRGNQIDWLESDRGDQIDWPEPGVCVNWATPAPRLSADGRHLYCSHMSVRRATAVYRHELATARTTRLTDDPSAADPDRLVGAELHRITSFDGEPIQLYLLRPSTGTGAPAAPPVVVLLHGGPALQSQLRFDPIKQALVAAGYAVVVPNVRGSTGYGRRFAALDDVEKRLDAVADLAAVHRALPSLGLDPGRAALWGESYGGYMVLAGLSMQPELWAAGVEVVGISDMVTFLENTSRYRRVLREVEYGSLERDRAVLERISPMTYADQIRAPLFVIHGRNDPRVPVGESEALHARLTDRGRECELVVYANEGHGLARLENRLDAYPRAIDFLGRMLGD